MYLQSNITDIDERSFKHFVDFYSSNLLYYVLHFVRSKEEAEEIVSDVFFEVWQNRDKLREIQNMKAWLITIAHNKTISFLRKKDISSSAVSWDEVGEHTVASDLQTPYEQLISKEEIAKINNIINNLPLRCKQVFLLAKVEKLLYKDIAEILGISVKTINIHIAKALETIAEGLKK